MREGKACAAAIVEPARGQAAGRRRRLIGTCYNTVAPGYAFSQSGIYQPRDDMFAEVEGLASPARSMRRARLRQREADDAQAWFKTITVETFG